VAGTKTYVAKPGEIEQKWWIVDAQDRVIGRLASEIAVILMGKHRPYYTAHVDTGDFVIITNVAKLRLSGAKWEKKTYTWYTGYPGLRTESAAVRFNRKPEQVMRDAVRRMLPKNKLGRKMLAKLKIYAGSEHPHQSQNPQVWESASIKK
jgi:large subunit ribosomal protein L13